MHTSEQDVLSVLTLQRSGVPIYVQVREQMLGMIRAGVLAPGQRLPTMRQVAVALRVDLNTVRHAYEDLERGGAIVLRRGLGSFVAEGGPPDPPADLSSAVDALADHVVTLAGAAGIDPLHLAERIAGLVARTETAS